VPAADTGDRAPAPCRRASAGLLLALLLAACVGAVTLDGGFVFDDRAAILDNPIVQGRAGISDAFRSSVWGEPLSPGGISSYRPLSPLLWRTVWGVFPGNAAAYRVLSLVLHVLAVALFWRLGRALGAAVGPLTVAAAVFAVHPVHAEAVGGIVGQSDILASCLGLLALEVCVRARRLAGSCGALLLLAACLAKESAVIFGAGALVLIAFRDEPLLRRARSAAVVLAVCTGFVIAQLSIPRSTEHWNSSLTYAAEGLQRPLLGAHLVGRAAALLAVPARLSPVHGYAAIDLSGGTLGPYALLGFTVLAGLAAAALGVARRPERTALLVMVLLAGPLLQVSGFPVRMPTDLPERILYPATMAAGALVAWLLYRWASDRVRRPAAAALVVIYFAAGALAQRPWHAEAALWERAVRVEPKAIRGQMNLSLALEAQGRVEEAAWHRLLAAWINDRYPAPVAFGPVELLERDLEPLSRIAEAPARLQPGDPCRLVSGVLGVYRTTLPQFEGRAGSLYAQRYPECFGRGARPGTAEREDNGPDSPPPTR
jgi:hypothetical protein